MGEELQQILIVLVPLMLWMLLAPLINWKNITAGDDGMSLIIYVLGALVVSVVPAIISL